jgi:hypothetical protein
VFGAMPGSDGRSLVRLELRPGARALYETRLVQIEERLHSKPALVTDERFSAAIGELQGREAIATAYPSGLDTLG